MISLKINSVVTFEIQFQMLLAGPAMTGPTHGVVGCNLVAKMVPL